MSAANLRAHIIASLLCVAAGCDSVSADEITRAQTFTPQVNATAVEGKFQNLVGMNSGQVIKLLGKENLSFPGPEPAFLYDTNNQQAIELLFAGDCVTSVKVLKSRDVQRFFTPCLSSGTHKKEHHPALQSHEVSWEVFRKCWKELIGMKGDQVAARLGPAFIDPGNQLCWQYCIKNQVLGLQFQDDSVQSFQLNFFAANQGFSVKPSLVDTSGRSKN